jgi:hypothetical protein
MRVEDAIMRAKPLLVAALASAIVVHGVPASAAFHFMTIDEVYFGAEGCEDAQYVVLRMLAGGQTAVGGKQVSVQNGDGSAAGNFGTFARNVSNGSSGASILIATAAAAALFGITPDTVADGELVFPDGRICFAGSVDCIAYGNYTGANQGGGTPATAPVRGQALARMSSSGSDAADFALAAPNPRNNAGESGTLGTCPGGEVTPTPTATPPAGPTATTGPPPPCTGDCNDDDMVGVNELITGVNIALGNLEVSACPDFDRAADGRVDIPDLIAAVSAALNGCSG